MTDIPAPEQITKKCNIPERKSSAEIVADLVLVNVGDIQALTKQVHALEVEIREHMLHVHKITPCCGVGYDEDTLTCEKCGEVVR